MKKKMVREIERGTNAMKSRRAGRTTKRKGLALMLALMLAVSLVPALALASDEESAAMSGGSSVGDSGGVGAQDSSGDNTTGTGTDTSTGDTSSVGTGVATGAGQPAAGNPAAGETAPGEVAPDESALQGEDEAAEATEDDPLAGTPIAPMSQTLNGNELTLKVANDSNAFVDVDDIAHAITWPLSTITKQIQVIASFSDPNTTKDRSVIINVPRGYKVLEYSATAHTVAPAGARTLGFSSTDEPKVASSLLTAADGSSWTAQTVTGYTGEGNATDTARRTYNGRVTYTFNSNADTLTLTLTLGLDQAIMSHATGTDTLADITVDMQSGTDRLSERLSTNANMLVVPTIFTSGSTAEGTEDPDDSTLGSVAEIKTPFSIWTYDAAAGGAQNHVAESATLTVGYPKGVTFAGFAEGVTAAHPTALTTNTSPIDADTFTSQTYSDGHLVVTLDKVARTVTLAYSKVTVRHGGGNPAFVLFWTAEVDNSAIKWDQTLQFLASYNVSSGLQTGLSETHPECSATSQVTVKKPYVKMTLAPSFATRSDLNAYAIAGTGEEYPYDYLLGGFNLNNASTSPVENLLYEFSFSPHLAIRGFSLPGLTGNTYSKIEATTNTGRIIELGPFNVITGNGYQPAVTLDALKLGLLADEYLIFAKAWQDSLNVAYYSSSYARSSINYYGRFQAGQEGDVTLKISGVADPANPVVYTEYTGRTTIASTQVGVLNTTLTTTAPTPDDGTGTGSFYPSGTINFAANITAGEGAVSQESILDPMIYISLPEGINLDATSVRATSVSGNHGSDSFALRQEKVTTKVINGVTWSVYAFTSVNPLDMVARPAQNFSASLQPSGYNIIKLVFDAKVSSSAPTYTGLRAQDILQWDVGQKAVNSSAGTNAIAITDAANVTGKGISYTIAAPTRSSEISIVQKPGLKVSLGIRTNGDTTPYYTYDGTEATVAPLTVNSGAQIWLEYENTAATAFFAGSEIYLPIPKTGKQYTNYFNDVVANPSSGSHDMRKPAWTGVLTGPVSLPGFKTLYSTDVSVATNDLAGATDSWVPTDISFSEATPANWADVTMIKFVATADIVSGAKGTTVFVMEVDGNAGLGQVDYWRAFQKGWTTATGAGSWVYGSVIAATPTMAGIEGMLYLDTNDNGVKDAGESFDPTAVGNSFTGVLTGTGITAQNLAFAADGSFKVVDSSGVTVHLKPGTYTINFSNATQGNVGFSSKEVPNVSNGTSWGMDIEQANIAYNHSTASYTFTVDSTMAAEYVLYMGVALRSAYTVSYAAETGFVAGTTFDPATEMVVDGLQVKSNPVITAAYTKPGYDYTSAGWKADKQVTLTDGTVIPANTRMTTAQLRMVKVTENLAIVVSLEPITYTISYTMNEGINDSTNPLSYTVEDTKVISDSVTRTGHDFAGWTVDYANTSITDITTPAKGISFAAGTTGDITLTANWDIHTWDVSYAYTGAVPVSAPAAPSGAVDVDYNSAQSVAAVPALDGYTFTGWIPTGIGTTSGAFTMPDNDVSFTGSWAANTNTPYTVEHYKVNSAGVAASVPFATESLTGTTDTTAAATVKSVTGYTHDASFAGTALSGNIAGDGSLVLKVYYRANSYTVSYDGNQGTGTMSDTSVYTDEEVTLPLNSFTREGYTFQNWNTESDKSGVSYSDEQTFTWTGTEDTTLFALWSPNTGTDYTVEHYLVSTEGSVVLDAVENLRGTTDTTATASVRYYDAYTYDRTYPDTHATGNIEGDGSLILKVYYTLNTYTVTFIDWNGSVIAVRESVSYGGAAPAPANPGRTGYTFAGWDRSFDNITSDITVRALYAANPVAATYTVSYLPGEHGTFTAQTTSGLTLGSTTPAAPETTGEEGWTFTGWSPVVATTVAGNAIYTAQWSESTAPAALYTVRFVDFDGTVLKTEQVERGGNATAPQSPTRDGYTFLRWDSSYANVQDNITVTAEYTVVAERGEENPPLESFGTGSTLNIFGADVPLFGGTDTASWSIFDLICALLAIILALVSALRFIFTRKNSEDENERKERAHYSESTQKYEYAEKVAHRRLLLLVVSLVIAVVSAALFALTQDMTQPMVMFDWWSVFFALAVALAALAALLVVRKKREETTFEEGETIQTA